MSKDEALKELRDLAEERDTEDAHVKADNVICELLKSLGDFDEIIEAYHAISKWYA